MSEDLRADASVQRRPDVLDRRCGDIVVILRRGTDEVRRLGGAAAAVWTVIGDGMSVADLIDGARAAVGTGIADEHVAANVTEALVALERAGLITVTPAPAGPR